MVSEDFFPSLVVEMCIRDSYVTAQISIHVPLAGNDVETAGVLDLDGFQSTFPLRGTTERRQIHGKTKNISIHVPLAGNDFEHCPEVLPFLDFNPRSPCGERLAADVYLSLIHI